MKITKYIKCVVIILLCCASVAHAKIYIFVSFSMSDASLKSYYIEAARYDAVLVMRGLLNDSFIDTQAKLDELSIGYDINPELFEKYKITMVPAIVKDTGAQAYKVTGHISLLSALEMFQIQ